MTTSTPVSSRSRRRVSPVAIGVIASLVVHVGLGFALDAIHLTRDAAISGQAPRERLVRVRLRDRDAEAEPAASPGIVTPADLAPVPLVVPPVPTVHARAEALAPTPIPAVMPPSVRSVRTASTPTAVPATPRVALVPVAPTPVPIDPPAGTSPPVIIAASPAPAAIDSAPDRMIDASVIDVPPPAYPRRSVRRGQAGDVLLEVEVLTSGAAGEVRVLESTGHAALDEAAIAAARHGRYRPAQRDGRPVTSMIEIPFEFRLQ